MHRLPSIDELKRRLWDADNERLDLLDCRSHLAQDRSMSGMMIFNFNDARINALIAETRYLRDKLRELNVIDFDTKEPSVVDIIWEMRDG